MDIVIRASPGQAGEGRHHGLGIGDDREIGALHHVGMQVGVHGHDALAARDALLMLGRAGDAEGEIAARLDQRAGGADLAAARQQAGIADDAAAALGGAERAGDGVEVVPVGDAVAGADDEVGLLQRTALADRGEAISTGGAPMAMGSSALRGAAGHGIGGLGCEGDDEGRLAGMSPRPPSARQATSSAVMRWTPAARVHASWTADAPRRRRRSAILAAERGEATLSIVVNVPPFSFGRVAGEGGIGNRSNDRRRRHRNLRRRCRRHAGKRDDGAVEGSANARAAPSRSRCGR
jgi:hypothetical protein